MTNAGSQLTVGQSDHFSSPSPSSISHLAHLVGAVVGLLVGLVLLRNRRVEHWQTWVGRPSLLRFVHHKEETLLHFSNFVYLGSSGAWSGVLPGGPGNPHSGNSQHCCNLHLASKLATGSLL